MARVAVLGGPAVNVSLAFEAHFDATKLPVAPQSTRMAAGQEPMNPASLMSALLGGVACAGTLTLGPLAATMEWCSFCNRCFEARGLQSDATGGGASPMSALATDASW